MNLVQIQERLKDLPMQAIMGYANGQNPQVPPYLALGELNRRKQMEQQAAQPPQGTVKDNIEQQVGLMQLQKARQGQMAQQSAMQGANAPMIPRGTPEPDMQPEAEMAMAAGGLTTLPMQDMNFGSGGIIAFAGGGDEGEELTKKEARAILKRMRQREGLEPRDPIEMPAAFDNTIPGFEAGNRFTQEMNKVSPRAVPPTPQQMEANVARPDMSDQIPGQSVAAPASTGRMPGEAERNLTNTMNAMPGASASKAFTGGARGLMSLLGNLPSMLKGSGQTGEVPMADADQNLGAAIMAQSGQRPAPAAAPAAVAPPVSRPTSQMTPQQMEQALTNAQSQGVAGIKLPPTGQRQPIPVARPPAAVPAAPAPAPEKSAAQLFQEGLLSGTGLPALPAEYKPPKQAPIAEEYLKYLAERAGKRTQDEARNKEVESARAKRDFFNSLIAGGEATRGQRGIGALFAGAGRSLGESMTAAEDRAMAYQEKQQLLADNEAKTRFEIANLQRAEERGDAKAAYDSKMKLYDLKQEQLKIKGQAASDIVKREFDEKSDLRKIAADRDLAALKYDYDRKLKGIPQAQRATLEEQYVNARVKGGASLADAIREVKTLGVEAKGQLTYDQASDNVDKFLTSTQGMAYLAEQRTAAKQQGKPLPDQFTIRNQLINRAMQASGPSQAPRANNDLLKAADAIIGGAK